MGVVIEGCREWLFRVTVLQRVVMEHHEKWSQRVEGVVMEGCREWLFRVTVLQRVVMEHHEKWS